MANDINNKMICRACLCDKPELLNSLIDNAKLMEMYKSCTYLQVNKNDNLPKTLCSSCTNQCVSWNSFKEMCASNELLLLGEVNCRTPVKILHSPQQIYDDTVAAVDDTISVENQIKTYLNNSTDPDETKTTDLKVKFEEVTIKTEILLSDELIDEIANKNQNKIDEEFVSNTIEWDSTSEIICLDDKTTIDIDGDQIKNNPNELEFTNFINYENNISTYECAECDEKFTNKALLRIHMRKHIPPNTKWECSHCKRIFNCESYLLKHNQLQTCQLKCYICFEQFKTNAELLNHRANHLELRPFKCEICDRTFAKQFYFTAHMDSHTVGNKLFPCKKCNKSFTTNAGLQSHRPTHLEKSFMCAQCGKTFSNKYSLGIHMIDHNEEKPFKCNICNKGFKKNNPLKIHMTIHTGEKPFPCTLCDQRFRVPKSLRTHLAKHVGEKQFKCTECEKTFLTNVYLKNHMRTHSGERPHTCKICYKSFGTHGVLNQHKLTHSNETLFKCDLCDKGFHRNSHLINHKRTHTGEKQYKCTECEQEFRGKYQFNMHMECHANEKLFPCTVCEKSFNREDNLKYHMKSHVCSICKEIFIKQISLHNHLKDIHGVFTSKTNSDYKKNYYQKKIECPVCKKVMTMNGKYQHMLTHAEKSFKCELCSRAFRNPATLNQHMLIHTNERPHKCEYCDKTFKRVAYRNEHRKIHTGEAPTCKLCNKMYEHNADLIIHMRSHTGEKPFECTDCEVAFDSPAKLRKHNLKTHHVSVG